MTTITFSNGKKVNFNGNPTSQDVEEVANKLGVNKQSGQPSNKSNFIDKLGEFGSQAGREILRTVDTISSLGQNTLGKLVGVKETTKLPEGLTRQAITPSEKAGAVLGQGIQYMTPFGEESAVAKSSTILDKVLANSPKLLGLAKTAVKSAIGGAEFAGKTAIMGGNSNEVKNAGVLGVITPPAVKVTGKASKFIFGDVIPSILSGMTGIAPDAIKYAFNNPTNVAKYISEKVIPVDVRDNALKALKTYNKNITDSFSSGLNELAKLSPRIKPARTAAGEGYPGVFSGVKGQFEKKLNNGTENLKNVFNKYRISINGNNLDFDKLNSSIVSPTEQKQLQNVWTTINNQKDFSVRGVQDVAARINALSKYTEGVKTVKSAVASNIHNVYGKAIKEVYPKLGDLRDEYSASKQIISGIEKVLKSGKNQVSDPIVATNVSKKLVNLYNEDNEAYVRALKKLEDETGVDLVDQFVAANFDRILPGKMGSYIGQAGVVAGGVLTNPMILGVLPLFSPKVEGKILTTAGKGANVIRKVKPILPAILK